jgi:hypothetical protein
MNVNLAVPAGQVADFAIDFDACKSFVKAGNSGKYLLKPVLSVIPILSAAGQRIVGFVDPSLANTGTTVSAQLAGAPVRTTPPDATGRFVLYPGPAGTYDLVITASGRVNAVMTGVPVSDASSTVIGSDAARISSKLHLKGGAAMPPILPKKTWLERFATHLRLLRPQLSALDAAYVAMDEFVACDFDPKVAAAMYSDELTDEAPLQALWQRHGSDRPTRD